MNAMIGLPAFVQGLVAGVVALIVLAVRAALDGRPGPTFGDLWTSVAVAAAVGFVSLAMPRVLMWQLNRAMLRPRSAGGTGQWPAAFGSGRTPAPPADQRSADRFDRFSEAARRSFTLAQDEAQRFGHGHIGTEHVLLALTRDDETTAVRALRSLSIDIDKLRAATEFIIGSGGLPLTPELGLTSAAKRVVELSIDEARRHGHHEIGTGHLLLGLVREGQGIGAGVLESLGVTEANARPAVLTAMETGQGVD